MKNSESKNVIRNNQILLSAVVALFWFAQYVYVPYQTPYLLGQHVTSSFVGMVVGAYGISQMLARLPVGVIADIADKHKVFIILGAFSSGFASFVRIIWPSGAGFLVANLLSGLASAMWLSFILLYCSYYDKLHQQIATSRVVLYNNVGVMAAFAVATVSYDSWGMPFLCVTSMVAGIAAVFIAIKIRPVESDGLNYSVSVHNIKRTELIGHLLTVCKRKRLIAFACLMLIQQGIQMATVMSFSTQIMKDAGASPYFIGVASIVYMFSSVVMSIIASTKICTYPGGRFWIPVVFVLVAAYCILMPQIRIIPTFLLLQIIPGISSGILVSFLISESMVGIPKSKNSTAMGFFQAVYAVGMTIIPVIVGRITDIFSIAIGYGAMAIVAVLAAIAGVVIYRTSI